MKRVLLLAVALAAFLVTGSASASGSAECGAGPGAFNAATCTDTLNTITVNGAPLLQIEASIGPVMDHFVGDISVKLTSNTTGAYVQYTCLHRPTSGFASTGCLTDIEGSLVDGELATCSGIASGVGAWKVKCSAS